MKKIRIGKDIHLTWNILTNSEPQSLDGRDLKLVITNPLRVREDIPFTVSGNTVEANLYGKSQKHLGVYMLTLWENFGQRGQTAVDACKAFQLVPYTCMEGDSDNGLDTETVDLQTGNLELLTEGAPSTVSWDNVTGKPELFPPSQHKHEISDVNNLNATLDKQSKELAELSTAVDENTVKVVDVEGTDPVQELLPNTFYRFGECATLTVTLGEPTEDVLNEYLFSFISGATATVLSVPSDIVWMGDNSVEPNKTYEVSIVNNIAVMGGVS